uniref:Uncharacterized protein n=1 Tax=Arundo donax TaxID=35708 RepID=A0A0A9FEM6_ARUDO
MANTPNLTYYLNQNLASDSRGQSLQKLIR